MNEPVDLTFTGPLALVTLNNPPLNIFDLAMRDELIGAFTAIDDVPDVRAMVLRSAGRHFSAGADLSEFGSAPSIFEARRIRWDRDPWGLLWDLRVPTVAAITGTALGSGLEMSLLCDLRIAAPDAVLGLPETKLGMLPAAGGTQSLTRAIGPGAALPVVALAEPMPGTEAQRRGIVHETADDPGSRAVELAHELSLLDPAVIRAARRALRAAGDLALDDGLRTEGRLARSVRGQRA
ncbi:MAG: enoyl-CoA hydratase/isomerase family protein [Actinomycetota bacterium]